MSSRINFAVAVKLVADGFNQGANRVRASLRAVQFQAMAMAGALGAGALSATGLLQQMVQVAREAGSARKALENVSGGVLGYSSNMKYLMELSERYGVSLTDTTASFAKFTASASASGMLMVDQRKIFEATSRAVIAFGLGAEDAKGAFTAISQMMSKGKVNAEELRGQLGDRLPIAMEAMARAAGVPVSQLDDLLKKGKLLSAEVLPKFADELNKLTPNVNTDNLETSINRLKNAFLGLTDDIDIYGKFKRIVDGVRRLLEGLREDVSLAVGAVAGLWGGVKGAGLFSGIAGAWQGAKRSAKEAQEQERATAIKAEAQATKALEQERARLAEAEAHEAKLTERLNQARSKSAEATARVAEAQAREVQSIERLNGERSRSIETAERVAKAEARLQDQKRATSEQRARVAQASQTLNTATAQRMAVEQRPDASQRDRATALRAETKAAKALEREKARLFRAESQEAQLIERLNQARSKSAEATARVAEAQAREAQATERLNGERSRSIATTEHVAQAEAKLQAQQRATAEARARVAQAGASLSNATAQRVAVEQRQTAEASRGAFASVRVAMQSLATSFVGSVRSMLVSLRTMVVSTASMFVSGAVIGGIMYLISRIATIIQKTKEAKSMIEDARYERNNVSAGSEGEMLRAQLAIIKDQATALEDKKRAYLSIVDLLGEEGGLNKNIETSLLTQEAYQNKIEGAIRRQIQALEDKARLERAIQQKLDAEDKIRELNRQRKADGRKEIPTSLVEDYGRFEQLRSADKRFWSTKQWDEFAKTRDDYHAKAKSVGLESKTISLGYYFGGRSDVKDIEEMKGYADLISDASQAIEELSKSVNQGEHKGTLASTTTPAEAGKKSKKSELQKAEEDFARGLKELHNQRRAGVIAEAEYADATQRLAESTRERIGALLGEQAQHNKTYQQATELHNANAEWERALREHIEAERKASRLKGHGLITEEEYIRTVAQSARKEAEVLANRDELGDAERARLDELKRLMEADGESARIMREHTAEVEKLQRTRQALGQTEEEYNRALIDLITRTQDRLLSSGDRGQADVEQVRTLQTERTSLGVAYKERDTTFDYEHIAKGRKGELSLKREQIEHIRKELERVRAELGAGSAQAQALSLSLELELNQEKLLRVRQGLADLRQEALQGTINTARSIVGTADSVVGSLERMGQAFDPNSQANSWEQFVAVFDALTGVVDGVQAVVESIQSMSAVFQALGVVKQTYTAIDTATTGVQIANATAGASATVASATTEASALGTVATAATTAASAKVMAAHSFLPFVGVAVAGAMIGAMIATIASSGSKIPKFANGGIVPGSSFSGDKVLAGVNSGELILNMAQQRNLASSIEAMHKRRQSESSVRVTGTIRGRDLVLIEERTRRHIGR